MLKEMGAYAGGKGKVAEKNSTAINLATITLPAAINEVTNVKNTLLNASSIENSFHASAPVETASSPVRTTCQIP